MADLDQPIVTLELEELGTQQPTQLTRITTYNITSDYMTPTDAWSVTLYDDADPRSLRRLVTPLQPVKIYVDGNLQVIGRVDATAGDGDSRASMRVSGRDYLAALVGGGADTAIRFQKSETVHDALLRIAAPFGITEISGDPELARNILSGVVRKGNKSKQEKRGKDATLGEFKINPNEGAFEAMNKIAARHGLTIQPQDARHKIAVVYPDYEQAPRYKLSRSTTGNILTGSARRSYGNVPTLTQATGRNTGGGVGKAGLKKTLSTFGKDAPSEVGKNPEVRRIAYSESGTAPRVIDFRWDPKNSKGVPGNKGLLYQPLYYEDKDSRNLDELERGVRRMIAEKLRETLTYSCTVRGHTDPASGCMWAVDTIADVYDETEDVDEPLWIHARTFRNDGSGPFTDLELIRPHSYEL